MFRHPKYYKNLRKLYRSRNRDQAISKQYPTGSKERAPGTGLKLQAATHDLAEATGNKLQASSVKPQAASSDILEPRYKNTEEVFLGKGPRAFTMIKVLLG